MKEILLKFETEELYKQFLEVIALAIHDKSDVVHLEYDFQNDIGIISNNKIKNPLDNNV